VWLELQALLALLSLLPPTGRQTFQPLPPELPLPLSHPLACRARRDEPPCLVISVSFAKFDLL
jgi:hypothetical protein